MKKDKDKPVLPSEEDNDEDSDAHKNLSGLLAKFRKNMDAQVIFLLSDKGVHVFDNRLLDVRSPFLPVTTTHLT